MIYWRIDASLTINKVLVLYYVKNKRNGWVLLFSLDKTNRFHVSVRLFISRSQKTSKFCKNIYDTLGCSLYVIFFS